MRKIVRMSAGLANRMFQYAFSLYLNKQGLSACQDNRYKATTWKMEDIDWARIFPYAPINQATDFEIFRCGGGYNILDKVRRHHLPFLSSVWTFSSGAFDMPSIFDIKKYNYFIGVFVNAAVVNEMEEEVKSRFVFSPFEDVNNILLATELQSCNSVAIHVRKGKDYLNSEAYHGVCSLEYYKRTIAYICERVENPKFYLFTDNPDWVKENLYNLDFTLVDWNPGIGWGNHFDMQLMSLCKHNIIANSTYSWWGAFLNTNSNKIVISPKNWFNPNNLKLNKYSENLLLKDWIAL